MVRTVSRVSFLLCLSMPIGAALDKPRPKRLEYITVAIKAIDNKSLHKTIVNHNQETLEVNPETQQHLKKPIAIPFVSIIEYLDQYAKLAQGKTFIPNGALLINVGERKYGLWQHEKGIFFSPDPKNVDDETKPKKLLASSCLERKSLAAVLKVLLIVGKNGEVDLEDLQK